MRERLFRRDACKQGPRLWPGLAFLAALALSAAAGEAPPPAPPNPEVLKEITLVIFGQPYTGALVPPATDTEFQFRPKGGNEVLTFRWTSLEESERQRVQKLFGLDVAQDPGHLDWGETLKCVRLKLRTGRVIEGLELPAQAHSGFRCLRTATQVLQIPKPDVAGEEPITRRESDLFTAEEGYERLIARKPPAKDSAGDQLELARACATMGLYDRTLDHLDLAKTFDPRTEERTQELRAEAASKLSAQQAGQLYTLILTALQRPDYPTAVVRCDEFLRRFPQDERRTKVEALRAEAAPKKDANFAQQVIALYYSFAVDQLHARLAKRTAVDEKGRPVPALPGKQITTRAGRTFRGALVSESAEQIVVKQDDLVVQIPAKDVISVRDVDLSKGVRYVEPTFAELKAYATDASGGLGKDVITRIAQALTADEDKVREAWDKRLVRTAVMRDGILDKPPTLTTPHTASYGKGEWLREGAATAGVGGKAPLPQRRRGYTNQTTAAANQQAAPVDPETSDDPEVWWKVQTGETKFEVLRAFAAEKLFKVRDIRTKLCSECAGRGTIPVFGQPEPVPCGFCRGLKQITTIVYE